MVLSMIHNLFSPSCKKLHNDEDTYIHAKLHLHKCKEIYLNAKNLFFHVKNCIMTKTYIRAKMHMHKCKEIIKIICNVVELLLKELAVAIIINGQSLIIYFNC